MRIMTMQSKHDISMGDYLIFDLKTKMLKRVNVRSRKNEIFGIALTNKDNFGYFSMQVI